MQTQLGAQVVGEGRCDLGGRTWSRDEPDRHLVRAHGEAAGLRRWLRPSCLMVRVSDRRAPRSKRTIRQDGVEHAVVDRASMGPSTVRSGGAPEPTRDGQPRQATCQGGRRVCQGQRRTIKPVSATGVQELFAGHLRSHSVGRLVLSGVQEVRVDVRGYPRRSSAPVASRGAAPLRGARDRWRPGSGGGPRHQRQYESSRDETYRNSAPDPCGWMYLGGAFRRTTSGPGVW